jgi:hypothetical protein
MPGLLSILAAGLAAWLAGAAWYGLLGRRWVEALGNSKAALSRAPGLPSAMPFILSFIADVVMAWVLALVLTGTGSLSAQAAISWALVLWMGFILAPLATMNTYAGRQPMLTLIDSGHWAFALIAAAVVLALLG